MQITPLGGVRNLLGEGAVWSTYHQALFWVDIHKPAVYRYAIENDSITTWPMTEPVSSLAPCEDGSLLLALSSGITRFDPVAGVLGEVVVPSPQPTLRFNDGSVGPDGCYWISTIQDTSPRDAVGQVYRLNQEHKLESMIQNIRIPNGITWSPDGARMYFSDTAERSIYTYPFSEAGVGTPTLFAQTENSPDGATVDEEGYIWSAEWGGWRVVRYASDGSVDRIIPLPVECPTSCAFGGPNLDILFVTSASEECTPGTDQPLAGSLFSITVGIRGRAENIYKG